MRLTLLMLILGTVALGCAAPAPGEPDTQTPEQDETKNDSKTTPAPSAASPEPSTPAPKPATPAPAATPPAAVPPAATANSTCETAQELGPVNGDDGSGKLTAQGKCAQWVQFRAVENDSGFFGSKMSLKVTLVNPAGGDFDLVAFMNRDQDLKSCGPLAIADSEKPGSTQEQFDFSWGEGFAANDADDSRIVTIQVKNTSGVCSTQPWQLTIEGNK